MHEQTLATIGWLGGQPAPALAASPRCAPGTGRPVTVAGIPFPGLVGLAAGMDKNGVGVQAWAALGFGHAELGTVTAQAAARQRPTAAVPAAASGALINRMGFNNLGAQALADRLAAAGVARGNQAAGIPIGISIGKTKTSRWPRRLEDYLTSLRLLAPYADYVAINVPAPTRPGLRSLQDAGRCAS